MEREALQCIVGRNLKRYRNENHLTQEILAEKLGISTSHCANLESGKKTMSLTVLRNTMDVLQISADSLLYEDQRQSRLQTIVALLRDQPDDFICFAEEMIRLCLRAGSADDHASETGQSYPQMKEYAAAILGDTEPAEDAVQEALAVTCMKAGSFRESESPRGWTMKVLKFTVCNIQRRSAWRRAHYAGQLGPDDRQDTGGDGCVGEIELDISCIGIVGEGDYRIFKAVTLKRMTVREAVRMWGISAEAAKKRMQRLRKALRDNL